MRKTILLVAALLALSLATVGCSGRGLTVMQKPEVMLETILDASSAMSSYTSTVDLELQVYVDPAGLSPEDADIAGMFQGPVSIEGTLAFSDDTQTVDMDLTLGMAGFTYNMGIRMLGQQMWLRMFGQWYDFTPALEEGQEGDMSPWEQQYDPKELERRMTDLGIDPLRWFGSTSLAGRERLEGEEVLHLACVPDVGRLLDDAFVLIQDREFMNLLDPTGSLLELLGQDLVTLDEWEETRAEAVAMFQDFSADLWASKSDSLLRQMVVYGNFVPPRELELDGFEGLELNLRLAFSDINEPVVIDAPERSLPFSAFEDMLGDGSGLMPFMDGSGGDLFRN